MATVQNIEAINIKNHIQRDGMNNEISSTSSDENQTGRVVKYNNYNKKRYKDFSSDNETDNQNSSLPQRHHYKSLNNINDSLREYNQNSINSISNIDLSLHSNEIKKFESFRIPIVGYEVMEERARFTIYKLKVEDDKRDQSWLVFRRYTDFVRLYNRIKNEQPNLVLPLPGKRWFRDNFEPAFLEDRVQGLQVFVNSVVSKLPDHPVVRDFFCMDEPPQVFTYQPEVQAVYGALEDSITTLKIQLKQKDATIMHLQNRLLQLEERIKVCPNCSSQT
ncbi:sorting nexin-16 [Leptidea sinapis]|uniref:sorting nexin-16 n=1 Tax=Leptidea sinapis TaxID=189913 RepID=UPI0021299096|nr:sorting nexin-16 [Leptidea sinapis]